MKTLKYVWTFFCHLSCELVRFDGIVIWSIYVDWFRRIQILDRFRKYIQTILIYTNCSENRSKRWKCFLPYWNSTSMLNDVSYFTATYSVDESFWHNNKHTHTYHKLNQIARSVSCELIEFPKNWIITTNIVGAMIRNFPALSFGVVGFDCFVSANAFCSKIIHRDLLFSLFILGGIYRNLIC